MIGNVGVGGDNPIRVQSMTTADTMDTEATVQESIRMIDAGCEIVRITAPSKKEAENLSVIKNRLAELGYHAPLVADIHFTPNAAEIAAKIVEKVRVNPGNYADKKRFEHIEYTDESYQAELDRIKNRFLPLVQICKEYGTAMRIGTNHGSLSDRILSRFGDTPEGMVASAMEFVNICVEQDYFELVLSMKASNPKVMIQAYRLLVAEMIKKGLNFPLHLGVTEAGDGEDGRIKSAAGIGTLLEEGLGDTIRVSLTEAPEAEIPVADQLAKRYNNRTSAEFDSELAPINPFSYQKRITNSILTLGGKNVPRVIADYSTKPSLKPAALFANGYNYSVTLDKWTIKDNACDFIYLGNHQLEFELPGTLAAIINYASYKSVQQKENVYPLLSFSDLTSFKSESLFFVKLTPREASLENLQEIASHDNAVIWLNSEDENPFLSQRNVFYQLTKSGLKTPVVSVINYATLTFAELQLHSATDIGGLLVDGFSDGCCIISNQASPVQLNDLAFNIFQNTRTRISKTEYISCPSCGRTLFDLQETTAKIRSRTNHLKGIKIGIMGCIVNGPGEMADADYGYVGTGPGKITLYKEKEVVKRNVASENAVDELINLIKDHGDWVEVKEMV